MTYSFHFLPFLAKKNPTQALKTPPEKKMMNNTMIMKRKRNMKLRKKKKKLRWLHQRNKKMAMKKKRMTISKDAMKKSSSWKMTICSPLVKMKNPKAAQAREDQTGMNRLKKLTLMKLTW